MTPRNKTKSEPLVKKKFCERFIIADAEREEKKLKEAKLLRKQKERENVTKININKSVNATGTHKRLKYKTHKGTNNEASKIRRKTHGFEPHFSSVYKHEPEKYHWSTTAVKSIDFVSFSSGFETIFRKHHKGDPIIIYTICRLRSSQDCFKLFFG